MTWIDDEEKAEIADERDELQVKLDKVLKLHNPWLGKCNHCDRMSPCPTAIAAGAKS